MKSTRLAGIFAALLSLVCMLTCVWTLRRMRHLSMLKQTDCLNRMLRGHYAYYGIAGNIRALQRVHRTVERY
jgi:hypothetical protein